MQRAKVWACIAVAWLAPLAWLALNVAQRPSDGTSVGAPTLVLVDRELTEAVEVLQTYGRTPLQRGDRVVEIDGRDLAAWVDRSDGTGPGPGDELTYRLLRVDDDENGLTQDLTFDVPVTTYPIADFVIERAPVGDARQADGVVSCAITGIFSTRGSPASAK